MPAQTKAVLKNYFKTGDVPTESNYADLIDTMSTADEPIAHSPTHKHGGGDEVGVSTPSANAIVKAGSDGTIDPLWIPASLKDHGNLTGRDDDDHTLYLTVGRHDTTARHPLGTVVPHDVHANLSGRDADDHTQYLLVNGTRNMSGNFVPSVPDTYDLGTMQYWWKNGYISQLAGAVMVEYTQWVQGGWLTITKDQGAFATEVLPGATVIDFGREMTNLDYVLVRAIDYYGVNKVEYIHVSTKVDPSPIDYRYNVVRDKAAANSPDPYWGAGTPFAVLGYNTGGWIELNAYDSPRISLWKRTNTAFNSQEEIIRIGDLTGHPNAGSTNYGIFIGSSTQYLKYDGTTLSIAGNGSGLTSISGGNITTGSITATQIAATTITAAKIAANTITAGQIAAGTITATEIAATTITAAKIATGTITATQIAASTITGDKMNVANLSAVKANTGTLTVDGTLTISGSGKLLAGTVGGARTEFASSGILSYNSSNVLQLQIQSSNGALTAGGGNVFLNSSGLSLYLPTSTPTSYTTIKWERDSIAAPVKIFGYSFDSSASNGVLEAFASNSIILDSPLVTFSGKINFDDMYSTTKVTNLNSDMVDGAHFSDWNYYTPTFTGFTTQPTNAIARYCKLGRLVIVTLEMPTAWTSNSTGFTLTAPVAANAISNMFWRCDALTTDAGTLQTSPGRCSIAGWTITVNKLWGSSAFTASGLKAARFTLIYESG